MSTKGRDTSMKDNRGKSSTLPRKPSVGQQETKGRSSMLPRKPGVGQQDTKGRSSMLPRKPSVGQQETRGRSPTLHQKPGVRQQETRRRSPSLPRKTDIGQRGRSLTPSSILERKKTSTSLESRKAPTIPWPSATAVSRGPSARNPKKQVSPQITKSLRWPTPPSKVIMSTKSKSNPKNITTSSMKTVGSVKPKGSTTSRSPLKLKNSPSVKDTNASTKKQIKNGLGSISIEKKPIISNDLLSSQNDHDTITHDQEHNHILHGEVKFEDRVCEPLKDQDTVESEIRCDDNVSFDGSVDSKHTHDHDGHINQQDQAEETFDVINDHLDDHSTEDQESQEPENEQLGQEADVESIDENREARDEDIEIIESEEPEHEEEEYPDYNDQETERDDELVHEENKLEEPEHEETDIEDEQDETIRELKVDNVEVPEEEDTKSEVVKSPEVVMHGKKDSATYNDVIEETVSKLREQRKNRVLALAGAFETVISLESDTSPKDLSPRNI